MSEYVNDVQVDPLYVGPEHIEVLLTASNQAPEGTLRYAHPGDAGADLCASQAVTLNPFERALVPTGVAIALPPGYVALIHPRSGLAIKQGVTLINAPGTVDAGYRGEIKVPLINLDPVNTVHFEPGDRIAQLVIQRYVEASFVQVDQLPGSERSTQGFGSSGVSTK